MMLFSGIFVNEPLSYDTWIGNEYVGTHSCKNDC